MFWRRATRSAGFWGILTGTVTAVIVYALYKTDVLRFRSDLHETMWGSICAFAVGAIAMAMAHLAGHPDDRARLLDDPDLLDTAVEEFVRVATPVQGLGRTATHDTVVGGCPLQAGDRLKLRARLRTVADERLREALGRLGEQGLANGWKIGR